jgi:hypothetical protein
METALEENRRMNSDRAEAMLVRAYNMYRHPLLISLQTDAAAAALADPSSVSSTMFKGIYPFKPFSMYILFIGALKGMPFISSKSRLTKSILTSLKSLLKEFTQRVYSKSLFKEFTQRVYSKSLLKEFTQRVYSKSLLKEFTQRVYSTSRLTMSAIPHVLYVPSQAISLKWELR